MKIKIFLVLLLLLFQKNVFATDYGSGVYINIEAEQGINKPIFSIEDIQKIYSVEATIMFFILSYTFVQRLLGKQKKRKITIFGSF